MQLSCLSPINLFNSIQMYDPNLSMLSLLESFQAKEPCNVRRHRRSALSLPWWIWDLGLANYLTAKRLAKAKKLKIAVTAGITSDYVDLNAATLLNWDSVDIQYFDRLLRSWQ